jgi:hypothetical protein
MSFSVSQFEEEIQEVAQDKLFTVFLCGPTMKELKKPSAALRKLILDDLEGAGFEVVLGEDDGLVELQDDLGGDAQTNELGFINKKADAVVLIADSPGSYSELGLFSHHHSSSSRKFSFILLINKTFNGDGSYISQGPVQLVEANGNIIFTELEKRDYSFDEDIEKVLRILKTKRFKTLLESGDA